MTQLEVYQAMRKMHNRSAIVVRNGRRMYAVGGTYYLCVTQFIGAITKGMNPVQKAMHITQMTSDARKIGANVWFWGMVAFPSLDKDMTKGMAERSKFIDDLIKIAEDEK